MFQLRIFEMCKDHNLKKLNWPLKEKLLKGLNRLMVLLHWAIATSAHWRFDFAVTPQWRSAGDKIKQHHKAHYSLHLVVVVVPGHRVSVHDVFASFERWGRTFLSVRIMLAAPVVTQLCNIQNKKQRTISLWSRVVFDTQNNDKWEQT